MARPQFNISVPRPCSENWNAMTPQAKGRFCASCATTVIDFSQFTDKQLLDYFSKPTGKVCGRFTDSQLNRPVYAELLPKQSVFPKFLAAAAALFLCISSQAQIIPKTTTPLKEIVPQQALPPEKLPEKKVAQSGTTKDGKLEISGILLDGILGEPIVFGTIYVKNTRYYTQTDIFGKFKLVIPDKNSLEKIVIQAPYAGYLTKEIVVSNDSISRFLEIKLEPYVEKNSVEIITYGEPLIIGNNSSVKGLEKRRFNHLILPVLVNQGCSGEGEASLSEKQEAPSYPKKVWWKIKNLFRKND